MNLGSSWVRQRHLLGFALLSCVVALSTDVSGPLTDHFHEGEFLGFFWHMRQYHAGLAKFPLLVHGGMDYIPAFLANILFGHERAMVGTRIVLASISAIQYFLFLDIGYSLLRRSAERTFWVCVLAAYFWYSTPPLNSPIVVATYFPVRDIFLTLTLWSMVNSVKASDSRLSNVFVFVGSVSTVMALFWCYNRGLIAAGVLCIFLFGLLVKRKLSGAVTGVGSALLFLLLLERLKVFGTFAENLHNILYWVNVSSEINYLRWQLRYLPALVGLLALCLFALVVGILFVFSRKKGEMGQEAPIIVGLLFIQAMQLHVVLGVPTLEYELHGGWPSILLLLFYFSRVIEVRIPWFMPRTARVEGADSSGMYRLERIAVVGLTIFLVFCNQNVSVPYARFLKNVISPVANEEILPDDIVQVSNILKDSRDPSFFNWVNDGVLAFLAGKKFCTDYTYVYYAGGSREQSMLSQLKDAAPSVVITAADLWPATRHSEPMSERFPTVSQYIEAAYPRKGAVGRYQLAFRRE